MIAVNDAAQLAQLFIDVAQHLHFGEARWGQSVREPTVAVEQGPVAAGAHDGVENALRP
jgi:hypothetical protein